MSRWDKLRAEKTRLRHDNEPAMRLMAEKIAAFRHPRATILSCSQAMVRSTRVLEELKEPTRAFKLPHER